MLRTLTVLATATLLSACGGDLPLNSPDRKPLSFHAGPTVWKEVGTINHRCQYDASSLAAKVACEDQLRFIEQALTRFRPKRGNNWYWREYENIYLRCDAPHGTAGEIRACTRKWQRQLEGHPYYFNFDRPDGNAPRVIIPNRNTGSSYYNQYYNY